MAIEDDCPGGLGWAYYYLGECIRNTNDRISIGFGIASITAWIIFGIPQMVENCRKKIPDAAVSVFLLLFWILGDSLNLIGGILTGQLFLQILLAAYTILSDLILSGQYLYYKWLHTRQNREQTEFDFDDKTTEKSDAVSAKGKVLATVLLGVVGISFISASQPTSIDSSSIYGSRRLFEDGDSSSNFLPTVGEKIGYVFGWISFFMYSSGRCHQIYLNWTRKSTEGLSLFLFVLAVLGNTFYACQIFIKSTELYFILSSLPWILGSLGMLVFDFIIFTQFFRYRHNKGLKQDKAEEVSSIEDETIF
ncbi:hypothetical protein Aperf_G00000099702 [Anoplocephala perfoliata]